MVKELEPDLNQAEDLKALNRRILIRHGAAVAFGITSGVTMLPLSLRVNSLTEKATGHHAGNPNTWKQIKECENNPQAEKCLPHQLSTKDKARDIVNDGVVIPYIEEKIFRDFPANKFFDDHTSAGKKGLTRREMTVGLGSSTAFGLAHNVFAHDTTTIPASQTVSGFGFWYLRRKFGFASNFLAHASLNLTAMFTSLFENNR